MKVLIACECSQAICLEFRMLGDEAYSCDLEPEYGGHPEWHILGDARCYLNGDCCAITCDNSIHYIDRWDLVIAHPPCTYLSICQNKYYNRERFGDDYVNKRLREKERAVEFFMLFTDLDVPYLIENPIGCMSKIFRKPDQIIQPWQFGESATKATCLWLNGLPRLTPTKIIKKPAPHAFPKSHATMSDWYYRTSCLPHKERARARSKTFPGIARAIAQQYHAFLQGPRNENANS